jgi:ABC-type multidrug transport system fused ATPase/permease subunit
MDYTQLFTRAWHMVRHYRTLWVFGLVLALTTASFGSAVIYRYRDEIDIPDSFIEIPGPGDSVIRVPGMIRFQEGDSEGQLIFNYGGRYDKRPYRAGDIVVNFTPPADFSIGVVSRDGEGRLRNNTLAVRPGVVRSLLAVAVVLATVGMLCLIVSRIARYVSEAALVRMVAAFEQTGIKYTVRQGFQLGWSRSAWRILCINWVITLPVVCALLVLLVLAAVPLIVGMRSSTVAGMIGALSSAGLLLLVATLAVVVNSVLSLLKHLSWRACVLEGLGVVASIRRGMAMVRRDPKDSVLVWLSMVVVDLVWPILMAPIGFALAAVGVVLGGLATLLAGGLAGQVVEGVARWIAAGGLVGLPVLLIVVVAPLAFLAGLREVFQSSTWTLTYRQLRAMENVEPGRLLELAPSGAE